MATRQTTVNLAAVLVAAGLPVPAVEYRFCERRWRWDVCWPRWRVAVERQGGSWTGGRHTRGAGYRADCEKATEGQILGWLVVAVTADMLRDGTAISLIERALQARGWQKEGGCLQ